VTHPRGTYKHRHVEEARPHVERLCESRWARESLTRSRAALLDAIGGVDEEDFYRLGTVGREEYSVVSVIENVTKHDVEHLGQIISIRVAAL